MKAPPLRPESTPPAAPPAAATSTPGERWASHLECARTGVTAPLDEPAGLSPAGAPWLVRYDLAGKDGLAWAG